VDAYGVLALALVPIAICLFVLVLVSIDTAREDFMSQDFESIGTPSDELQAVAEEKQGRQGSPARPQVDEMVADFDFSRYDRRSNLQALGHEIANMAGYSEGSMAGHPVTPWAALGED